MAIGQSGREVDGARGRVSQTPYAQVAHNPWIEQACRVVIDTPQAQATLCRTLGLSGGGNGADSRASYGRFRARAEGDR